MIKTDKDISEESLQIHGIKKEELLNAPNINDVILKFIEFVEDSILIAHNAQFDISFLKPEWENISPFIEFPTTLCSKEMDKLFYPDDKFHNLDVVCARWGVDIKENRHRALTDAIITAQCVQKMLMRKDVIPNIKYLIDKTAEYKDWRHR